MMQFSNPPAAGALLGLILGLLEYVIAMAMFRAYIARETEAARKAGEALPGEARVARHMNTLRYGLLALALIIYPAIGYAVARNFFI
ncbi:MAG: hypothetical protein FJX29_02695 [Alphaproteobacteria bacterium]|nr:hypothetical protein [Alphaproteobacteria bacterium]